MSPHACRCAYGAAPRGGCFALGRPGGETFAPTLGTDVSSLPPEGGCFALGRPSGETLSPRASQKGAALLAAMLTVTLVATLASAAMWQQWRSVEIESAERSRGQNAWVLTGALDWARLILREDARSGGADDLSEPWAVPLAESRLSTFLAAADQNAATDSGDSASETFLSGYITDQQSRLNVTNLVDGGKRSDVSFRAFGRLFELLGLPSNELGTLTDNLRLALETTSSGTASGTGTGNSAPGLAPLLPQRLPELAWLGLSPVTIAVLQPYITLLPARTPVNLNTASAEVIYASIPGIDMAQAQRMVSQRERSPFKTLADAVRLTLGVELNATEYGVATRFFEVRGRLRTPRGIVEEQSLIQRDGLEVRIVRRERLAPDLRAAGRPTP